MKLSPGNSSQSRPEAAVTLLERRRWMVPVLAAVLSLAIVVIRLQLWEFDLRAPFAYNRDALHFQVMVKALGESAWNDSIARLGAPFGLEAVDFPIRCSLDYAVMKLLMGLLHNPFLVVNLYWLLSIGLAGAAAALLLRFLRIGPIASLTGGVLFAIIPFAFFRSVAHLNLATFLVPAGAYLAVLVGRGELSERCRAREGKTRKLLVPFLLCVAIGFAYGYWAFFTCILVGLSAVVLLFRQKQPRLLLGPAVLIGIIGLGAVVNLAPTLYFWQQHGRNPALDYKRIVDADTYGLRLRQMFTPVFSNGLPWLQRAREKIVAAGFPEDVLDANESKDAALGILGMAGFVLLVLAPLSPRTSLSSDITLLASLNHRSGPYRTYRRTGWPFQHLCDRRVSLL